MIYFWEGKQLSLGPVKRKCVFKGLQPVKIQTSLLNYRD